MKGLPVIFLLTSISSCTTISFYRTYECINNSCRRTPHPINIDDFVLPRVTTEHTSLDACRLVCEKDAALWPVPTEVTISSRNYIRIHPNNFNFVNDGELSEPVQLFLRDSTDRFVENLWASCGRNCGDADSLITVSLQVATSNTNLDWDTDESYELHITPKYSGASVVISAQTIFGARHGLETLSQLTAPLMISKTGRGLVLLVSADIRDKPAFPHRGLLLDTARNFLPVDDILRTLDALASVKMNALHWHATDSQSFPLEIKTVPQMSFFGSYGPDKVYSNEDMQRVEKYAKSRGIRVILELDSPSHAGAGWEWGESEGLDKLALCVNQQPWRDYCIQPPCGQLNPVNPNTFKTLRKIYRDLLQVFGRNGVLHIGGDELHMGCWNASTEVITELHKRGMGRQIPDFLKLWSEFHTTQLRMLDEESGDKIKSVIIWSSMLTAPDVIEKFLDSSRFVVQTWVESDLDLNEQLLKLGYKIIVSTKNAWYLDHGFWGKTTYHTWRDAYSNRIPRKAGVLGGEACMWGEYVFSGSLDSRVWPRTAAVAERLWSDPSTKTADAEPRLLAQIARLQQRGIMPEAVAPEWCSQHERQCL